MKPLPPHKFCDVMMVRIKRVYEQPSEVDGTRVLVDRLWPRGLSRNEAAIDVWLKDVAPTTELRKWFSHDPLRWDAFVRRYREELEENPALDVLRRLTRSGTVTLLYATRDEEHNQAVVLRQMLIKNPTASGTAPGE